MSQRQLSTALAIIPLAGWFFLAGCDYHGNSTADQRAREERTRDEVAKATERAKPALEEAGRKMRKPPMRQRIRRRQRPKACEKVGTAAGIIS